MYFFNSSLFPYLDSPCPILQFLKIKISVLQYKLSCTGFGKKITFQFPLSSIHLPIFLLNLGSYSVFITHVHTQVLMKNTSCLHQGLGEIEKFWTLILGTLFCLVLNWFLFGSVELQVIRALWHHFSPGGVSRLVLPRQTIYSLIDLYLQGLWELFRKSFQHFLIPNTLKDWWSFLTFTVHFFLHLLSCFWP